MATAPLSGCGSVPRRISSFAWCRGRPAVTGSASRPPPPPDAPVPGDPTPETMMNNGRFNGTDRYVATDDLAIAVNAAATLGRPLLVKGEPGTGKTMLAVEVARALGRPLIEWHIKSTTRAQQGLYEYDAVAQAARFAARRRPGPRHRQLHRARQALGGVRGRIPAGAADRRSRQGGHRVPERPPAGARPHGVLRLRDEGDGAGADPSHRHHHQQQREGAARRVPAPLLLPLHPVPRRRHHARDRRRAPSEAEEAPAGAGAPGVLRYPRGPRA